MSTALLTTLTDWTLTVRWLSDDLTQVFTPQHFVAQPTFSESLFAQWRDSARTGVRGGGEFVLDGAAAPAAAFLARARTAVADTAQVSLSRGGETVFFGLLERWEAEPGRLTIRVNLEEPLGNDALLCRDLAALAEGAALGLGEPQWLPQIFGLAEGLELVPLFRPLRATLRSNLGEAATEIPLRGAAAGEFPATGRAQIGEEVVTYASVLADPPRLATLTRPAAREHEAGAPVFLLPAGDPAWVAADHGATVANLRAGSPSGEVIAGATIAPATISGRDATTVSLPALPVTRFDGPGEQTWLGALRPSDWNLEAPTTATFAANAFTGDEGPGGANLAASTNVLEATWLRDLARTSLRFWQLLDLRLRFQVRARSTWGDTTNLRAEVSHGANNFVLDLDKLDVIVSQPALDGVAALASPADLAPALPAPDPAIVRFDVSTGTDSNGWANRHFAVSGNFDQWAVYDRSAGDNIAGKLTGVVHRTGLDPDKVLDRVKLRARIRASSFNLTNLKIVVSGFINTNVTRSVSTSWSTIELDAAANGATAADLIGAAFELYEVTGEDFEVAGFWIEATPLAGVGSADPYTPVELALAGQADAPSDYRTFEIDVSALLPAADPWALFTPGGDDLTVRFTLQDAPSYFALDLRGVRWVGRAIPPGKAEATARLFADVTGRLSEPDGACAPEAVLETLLSDGDFLALPGDILDSASFIAAGTELAAQNRRLRAAFAERLAIRDAFRRALAESFAVLAPSAGRWALRVLEATALTLRDATEDDLLQFPGPRAGAPPLLQAARLRFLDRHSGALLGQATRPSGAGQADWTVMWLADGFAELATAAFARFGVPHEAWTAPLSPAWLDQSLGTHARLTAEAWALANTPAPIIARRFEAGRLEVEVLV
ncbi:MAG: hypothetical protein RLY93_05825 [Sumerlaeia bacterium]